MIPLGWFILITLSTGVFTLRPDRASLCVICGVCYITQSQGLDLLGFNFTAIRIILLVGFIRIIIRGEIRSIKTISTDKIIVVFCICTLVVSTISRGSGAFTYQIGVSYNVLISYFVFRSLLNDRVSAIKFLNGLAVLICPMAVLMFYESITHNNIFKIFGGLPSSPWMREGNVRAQGAFRIAITAGIFGAALFPIYATQFLHNIGRMQAAIGMVASFSITMLSQSGAPFMVLVQSCFAMCFWSLRNNMKMVRWVSLILLFALSLAMKAPVYYLIARLSNIVGGHGWHRARLIEQAINYIDRWWLAGTRDTADWMPTVLRIGDSVGADITNKYIGVAIDGGIWSLTLFVMLFITTFSRIGIGLKYFRQTDDKEGEVVLWALGCTFFSHTVALISVQYWDQLEVAFYLIMALCISLSSRSIDESIGGKPNSRVQGGGSYI